MQTANEHAHPWTRWLTTDYTPWANHYVYWLKTPLGVLLALALVALLMGIFVTPQGYVLLLTVLVVIGLGIVWPWVGLRGVRCSLTFRTRRCREGEKAAVVVEVVNRWPFPVWGLSIERGFFVDNGLQTDTAVALARIPGWSRSQFVWEFQPLQRGVYPRSQPRIVTEFPFGLWKAKRRVAVSDSLIVWPKTFRLSNFPLPQGSQRSLVSPSRHCTGNEGERNGVRPFRQGDSLRTVHWSLTARHGRFIVSERQGSAQTQARVYVDADPRAHSGLGPDGSFEWTLRIAASIALELVEQHSIVVLDFGTHQEQLTATPASIHRAMDRIARLEPSSSALNSVRRRASADEWSLAIITDRSRGEWPTSRTIMLSCMEPFPHAACFAKASRIEGPEPWITVTGGGDITRQLLTQWSRKSREVWCGA